MLTELDVINSCLETLGISPVNQIDDENDFIASARKKFREENIKIQTFGWWFNLEITQLRPDDKSKFIYIPGDTISCSPINQSGRMSTISQKDRRLYDTRLQTFEFNYPVICKLYRLIPFEDLPVSAQSLVKIATVLSFQKSFDADMNKYRILREEFEMCLIQLRIENTRHANVNFLYNERTASKMISTMNFGRSQGDL